MFPIVKDHVKGPIIRWDYCIIRLARCFITILDAFQIPICETSRIRKSISFLRQRWVNVVRVLLLVFIKNNIALVIIAFFKQPFEHTRAIVRISYSAARAFSVDAGNVILRNRSPMDFTGIFILPALDTSKQSFNPWAVRSNGVVYILGEDGNKIFGLRKDKYVRVLSILV